MAGPPEELLTELSLESTHDLDRRSTKEILEAIHGEDRRALEAVGRVLPQLEEAADALLLVLQGGGRWFHAGAGTSGRLGVLDAAEIPPTFGYPHDRVQAVLAGGLGAFARAVEGAEDRDDEARKLLREHDLMPGDAVLAISASGRTPFALGALEEAAAVGARRLALTVDPRSPLARIAEIAIVPETGPEVIAGSTRMKAGLAQKAALHMLSTTVMVRLGRVEGNRMTNLNPASSKLRRRAIGIVAELGGVDETAATALLDAHGGKVADALASLRRR